MPSRAAAAELRLMNRVLVFITASREMNVMVDNSVGGLLFPCDSTNGLFYQEKFVF